MNLPKIEYGTVVNVCFGLIEGCWYVGAFNRSDPEPFLSLALVDDPEKPLTTERKDRISNALIHFMAECIGLPIEDVKKPD